MVILIAFSAWSFLASPQPLVQEGKLTPTSSQLVAQDDELKPRELFWLCCKQHGLIW